MNISHILFLAGLLMTTTAISASDVTVLVTRHRWHTGIVVLASQLTQDLAFVESHFDDPAWYEFGWGDSQFYRHDDNYWLMVRAMLWPTDSVLHVVGFERHPAAAIPGIEVEALCIPRERLTRLLAMVKQDFAHGGEPEPMEEGLYGDSLFFPANGNFWFARTCNVWTAQRLQQAGVDMRIFMTLTAGNVMDQVRHNAQAGACREH